MQIEWLGRDLYDGCFTLQSQFPLKSFRRIYQRDEPSFYEDLLVTYCKEAFRVEKNPKTGIESYNGFLCEAQLAFNYIENHGKSRVLLKVDAVPDQDVIEPKIFEKMQGKDDQYGFGVAKEEKLFMLYRGEYMGTSVQAPKISI